MRTFAVPHRPRVACASVHLVPCPSRDGTGARLRSGTRPVDVESATSCAQVFLPPASSSSRCKRASPRPTRRPPERLALADQTRAAVRRAAVPLVPARDSSARDRYQRSAGTTRGRVGRRGGVVEREWEEGREYRCERRVGRRDFDSSRVPRDLVSRKYCLSLSLFDRPNALVC